MPRHSPCVGICKLDEATGFCIGCARTGSEVADWIAMSDAERDQVWLRLPDRLAKLAIRVRLLPWTPAEIGEWATETVAARRGAWATGVPGATAEFPCTPEREIDVAIHANSVVARATDASFRLRINDKLRAFAFKDGGAIVLGMARGRASLPSHEALQTLGTDADAIDETHRNDELFDVGVGRKNSRFCVRTGDDALARRLSDQAGRPWPEIMSDIGTEIIAASPHRVVESAAARIEVFTPILPPDTPPAGARTRFRPDHLKAGEEIPASLALPAFAMPVAIFYPTAPSA